MDRFVRDLRYAFRTLLKSPGFSAAGILTVGLSIGAVTAIFALVDAILIRPLPYPASDRLVAVGHTAPGLEMAEADQSSGTYFHYREHSRVLEDIGVYVENVVNLSGEGGPERVQVALATASVYSMLGASPALGRLITADDDGPFRPDLVGPVVLSYELWRRRYGGDPGIIGRTIQLNSAPKQVVGIMEPGFDFPRPETQVWYPLGLDPATARFSGLYLPGIARLRPGVSPKEAEADLQRLIPLLADAYPDASSELLEDARLRAVVRPLKDRVVGNVEAALWILLVGVGFVLMIACANVGNLFLVRGEHRQKEVAVRVALGAGRGDLTRSLLGESTLIAASGGALGLALAAFGVRALVAFGPDNIPRMHEVGIDGRVLAVAAGLSIFASLLFGGVAAVRYGRFDLVSGLRDGVRGATASRKRQRVRSVLVASQVALGVTLVIGSALMAQSFWRLAHVDPGFDPENLLTLEIALPAGAYPDYARRAGFWHALLERVRALPGTEAAGAVSYLPLSTSSLRSFYQEPVVRAGEPLAADDMRPIVTVKVVTPGYFDALRIPLLEGRSFDPGDQADASNPVLVSDALAQRLFPGETAVGKRVRRADRTGRPWLTIAGVLGSVRDESLADEPAEILYLPVLEHAVETYPTHMSVVVRTGLPPLSLTPAVRNAVAEIDPAMPIANVRTMERIVADSTARTSFTMLLLLVAATVALFLGAVGIYGVVSYTVGRRTREIGVRMALGARPTHVSRMVVRQGAAVALAGLAAGLLAALWLTDFLRSLLFEVGPHDPLTFTATGVLLVALAIFASYPPARRAARVDPMEALRDH